jgi:PTH2 family peptidyl-tRNA hydrolase
MLIGTAIISIITGYMLGMASSLGFIPNPFSAQMPSKRRITADDSEESSSEEFEDDAILDHAPNWANAEAADIRQGLRASAKPAAGAERSPKTPWENNSEECKLVLVVRTDLGMTKGMDSTKITAWLQF